MGQRKTKRKKLYKQKSEEKMRRKREERDKTLDYAFLEHDATVAHVKQSKVMFIMRGLPGSGKSTIVQLLKTKYKRAVVCSADNYFLVDGEYKFDAEKLDDAHKHCKDLATDSCRNGRHVVIIDNTNVRRWEMKSYLDLARQHGYVVIVVLPKTPWCFDPEVLATKTKHGVTVDILKRKVHMFEKNAPVYWGWFLNSECSYRLKSLGDMYFNCCLEKVTEFAQQLRHHGDINSGGIKLYNYYHCSADDNLTLHCTSFFGGRGKVPGADEYGQRAVVRRSLGKTFTLWVIGFVITPRSAGARLALSEQQLRLWEKDDHEGFCESPVHSPPSSPTSSSSSWQQGGAAHVDGRRRQMENQFSELSLSSTDSACAGASAGRQGPAMRHQKALSENPRPSSGHANDTEDSSDEENEEAPSPMTSTRDRPRFSPTSGFGSRAHITLGAAQGFEQKQTGLDQIEIIQCEARNLRNPRPLQIQNAVIRHYGEGRCVVYLDEPLKFNALFTGRY